MAVLLTDAERRVLELRAAGYSSTEIASRLKTTGKAVTEVLEQHTALTPTGAGDRLHADDLARQRAAGGPEKPPKAVPPATFTPAPEPPPATPPGPETPGSIAGSGDLGAVLDTVSGGRLSFAAGEVIDRARAHTDQRIRRRGEKAAALVDELRHVLAEDEKTRAAREKVARLEAALAQAREELGAATRGRTPARGSSPRSGAKAIRLWAWQNGVECPGQGVIPRRVREAYERAQVAAR